MKRILKNDWEHHKKDPDIRPFYHMRTELYVAEETVFRMNKIVLPKPLQRKVIKAAHSMGHFGITKTKKMLRERYWFESMNRMIEELLNQCFECRVTTKEHRSEPVKTTEIPNKPWEVISTDFGGPYPDGHYNLVMVDKRTRYPAVETTYSTAFKPTKEALIKMFAENGTPRIIESDNGPPFNSEDFRQFAEEEGFKHKKVTPDHPRANGEAESFMKMLNKTEQITHLQKQNRKIAINDMLRG